MKIMQTITDYIRRSILTTQGDLLVRGAAVAERLVAAAGGQVLKSGGVGALPGWEAPHLSENGFEMGTITRSTNGAEVITGVGFQPSLVIFLFRDNAPTNVNIGIGFDYLTKRICSYLGADGTEVQTSAVFSIMVLRGAGNYMTAVVSALGGDGFTVTYSLTGTCQTVTNWFAIG